MYEGLISGLVLLVICTIYVNYTENKIFLWKKEMWKLRRRKIAIQVLLGLFGNTVNRMKNKVILLKQKM